MTLETKQKRQFWVILTIVFLGFLGISMPYLIFPALFLNPAYSILPSDWSESSHALFLGITLAAYPLGQFIGSPILGALSDDYGRKQILSGSLLLSALCNLFTGIAIDWHMLGLLIVSRFTAGVMEGNIAIGRAMAADLTSISKHKSIGKINACASIAYLIGPLLGGLMTDKGLLEELTTLEEISSSTPFYFICILFLGLAGISMLILENAAIKAKSEILTFWKRINFIKRAVSLFSNRRLRFLMIASTVFTLAVDIFYEFGPVYLTIKWELEPSQLIIYNAILCIALAFGNGWLPTFVSKRFSNRTILIATTGAFAFFLLGTVLTDTSHVMLLLFGLSGLVIGLAVTIFTVKISDSASHTIQGEVMGVQLSLRVLGDAIICLFGGVLLLISSKVILLMAAAMSATSMIYYGLSNKKYSLQREQHDRKL